jgi:hypothetical protein
MKQLKHRQAILWIGFMISLSLMFAGMTETVPGSGVYDWNTLSNLLMMPNTIGFLAVPAMSLMWALDKPKASSYSTQDAHEAFKYAQHWENNLEYEIYRSYFRGKA